MSNEFQVNIGFRQSSHLSPLLFIMELIRWEISTALCCKEDPVRRRCFDRCRAPKIYLHYALEEWKELFMKLGLKMNIDSDVGRNTKTRNELNIMMDGK